VIDASDPTARRPPRLLAVPDKFKGTASAAQVANAIAAGAARVGVDCIERPLADGGEGTLEVLGGANRKNVVPGPGGLPVTAAWRLADGVAVVEMALASGLTLAGGAENNDPVNATTRGTGALIREAILSGAREVIVGVGGSATTDGGHGALEALADFVPFPPTVRVVVAADVTTRFGDAAAVFAPQKGATPEQVLQLSERLRGLAASYHKRFGVDVESIPGSGAAGGLAGGLAAAGAEVTSGFDLIARTVKLEEAMADVDVVVTGEGHLDAQSMAGKVTGRVAQLAAERGLPMLMIVGSTSLNEPPDGVSVVALEPLYGESAWRETTDCIADAVERRLVLRVGRY
jgi:glycerate kinase